MAKKDTRTQARENSDLLLGGCLLAIDPSSTSFGWAVFKQGIFIEKGRKRYSGLITARLNRIFTDVYKMVNDHGVDILGVERLRSGGGYSPPQLLWSVGATMAAAPVPVLEVSPQQWRVAAKKLSLEKSDENDAHCIGHVLILMARGDY